MYDLVSCTTLESAHSALSSGLGERATNDNDAAKTKGFQRGMLGGRVLAVSPFRLCYYF
jgi:hypothetical protein